MSKLEEATSPLEHIIINHNKIGNNILTISGVSFYEIIRFGPLTATSEFSLSNLLKKR